MGLPHTSSLSPFWNVPLARHIHAYGIVISVQVHSLPVTIKLSRKAILSHLPLYFLQRFAHIAAVKEEPAEWINEHK